MNNEYVAFLKTLASYDGEFARKARAELIKEEERDDHGRWTSGGGGGSSNNGEGAHTPAHEASRANAVEYIGQVKDGWNKAGGNAINGAIGNEALSAMQDHIAGGGTRDELQAKVNEARAYADKLKNENINAFSTGNPPSLAELQGANQAETTARAMELGANQWDIAAKMSGK